MQLQVRRAAVSTAVNIVEDSARKTGREYLQFLNIAIGSAAETRYLLDLSCRLGLLTTTQGAALVAQYDDLVKWLKALVNALLLSE